MRRLTICAVLSVLLVVSSASPIKIQIHDESNSSESVESSEFKKIDKNSSSSEEEKVQEIVHMVKHKDNDEDNISVDSSEEQPVKNNIVKEKTNESNSVDEQEKHNFVEVAEDNEILKQEHFGKSKRAVDFAPHINNQLKVRDEGSIKYEKYLKLKRFRRSLESDASKNFLDMPSHILLRHERGADTSEEDSSVEKDPANGAVVPKKHNTEAAKTLVIEASAETLELAAKPDTATAVSEPKPEDSRRRRNTHTVDISEENSSEKKKQSENQVEDYRRRRNLVISSEKDFIQDQGVNEVFIFSNEKQQDSEESFKNDHLKNNEYVILDNTNFEKSAISFENKNSEEDYAKGCGGNNSNLNDDSRENSVESNETTIDKF